MNVLIFGGTTEGRMLSAALSNAGINVTLSVATEFGRNTVASVYSSSDKRIEILTDRLEEAEMINLMNQNAFSCVIDATHPYAAAATKNIHSACQIAGLKYYRLKRPESEKAQNIIYAPDIKTVVEILKTNDEKALLTIGSKELEPFSHIDNFAERFFIRILPMQESLKKAYEIGFRGSNIICMQGPFDREMNIATLKMTGVKYLITKDSGDIGGFEDKVSAALSLDCKVIVIARPVQEEGYSLDELLDMFNAREIETEHLKNTAFFPLFVDIKGKKVLVIGSGNVAERRIKVLTSFGADVTVIAPVITETVERLVSQGTVRLLNRKYKNGDIAELTPFFVITATDDRQTNHEAMTEATSLAIPISVADCREECTCYFPAIAESENYIAGLVSKNGDHAGVKRMASSIRGLLHT